MKWKNRIYDGFMALTLAAGICYYGHILHEAYKDHFRQSLFNKVCQIADTNHDGKVDPDESIQAVKEIKNYQEAFIDTNGVLMNIIPLNAGDFERGTLDDIRRSLNSEEMQRYVNSHKK